MTLQPIQSTTPYSTPLNCIRHYDWCRIVLCSQKPTCTGQGTEAQAHFLLWSSEESRITVILSFQWFRSQLKTINNWKCNAKGFENCNSWTSSSDQKFLNLSQHERDYITGIIYIIYIIYRYNIYIYYVGEVCSPITILRISSVEINCLHLSITYHWKNWRYFQLNFGNTK